MKRNDSKDDLYLVSKNPNKLVFDLNNELIVNIFLTNKNTINDGLSLKCFDKSGSELRNLKSWLKIIDNIDFYTKEHPNRVVNFIGGETLIKGYLDKLLKYTYNKNIKISLTINKSLLNNDFISNIKDYVHIENLDVFSVNNHLKSPYILVSPSGKLIDANKSTYEYGNVLTKNSLKDELLKINFMKGEVMCHT